MTPNESLADIDAKARQLLNQRRYAEAKTFYRQSLLIREQHLGQSHPDVSVNLHNLALVLTELGDYAEAESHYRRSLAIQEQHSGVDNPEFAKGLLNLGTLLTNLGNFVGAEQLYRRGLAIMEKNLGSEHVDVAKCYQNIGSLSYWLGNYSEAETLFRRSLMTLEKHLGQEHPEVADCINNLAGSLQMLGNYAEAESLYRRTLSIWGKQLGMSHPDVALARQNLAILSGTLGNHNEAEAYYRSSLQIFEQQFGPNHPSVADCLGNLASLLCRQGNLTEAASLFDRSLKILCQQFGPEHISVARTLRNLAGYKYRCGNYNDAEQLYRHSLTIFKKRLGPDNSSVATILNNLAIVLKILSKYDEAEINQLRSLVILEQHLGPEHPDVAQSLMNLSAIFDETGRTSSAILCAKRAINIFQKSRQNVSGIESNKEYLDLYDKSLESYYQYLADLLIKAARYGEAEHVMSMLKDKEFEQLRLRDIGPELPFKSIGYNAIEAPLIHEFNTISEDLYTIGSQIQMLKQIKNRHHEQNCELAEFEDELYRKSCNLKEFIKNLQNALPKSLTTKDDINSYKHTNLTDTAKNVVRIFTVTAENNFHTVMLTSEDRKAFSSEYKAMELSKKVLKFRELLKNVESDAYRPLAQELYDIIIRPMEQELNAKGIDTIVWMLDGVLRLLPLSALHDRKQFMLEKFSNVCITTATNNETIKREPWNGLGMGTTRKHDGHQPLPAVKDELEGIICTGGSTGVLPGDILFDEAFTRDSMQTNIAKGYKAVHFASHFVLDSVNETMSYLLLGDGSKIRMDELRELPQLF
ncbi:MAG: tetratricopeptide repeat protein, partial [Desulfobacter sp.]